ncbi:MAG: ABC transporter permease [Clostridia bacterium]|nr:ABC transporter permease [Clostridia bacterium]
MKKAFGGIYMALVFLFLYFPIAVMLFFSFNSNTKLITVFEGFTLSNYTSLFDNSELMEALFNTLIIAALSSVISCVLGTVGAIAVFNKKGFRKRLYTNVSNLPIINPEIVTGISLMLLFVFIFGNGLGMHTVLLAHVVFNTPYVLLNVLPRLRKMNMNMYEAALDLGCRPAGAFFKVVLPEIFPGIFAGFLIAFTYSVDDFIISYFTGGTFQTLSVFINNSLKKGVKPWMLSMSGLIFVIVLVILIIMNVRDSRAEKAKARAKF